MNGCNVSTCPNGKCKATGECQDVKKKPVAFEGVKQGAAQGPVVGQNDLPAYTPSIKTPFATVLGMAPGCCSAVSPCSHQKFDPYSICKLCKLASETPGLQQPIVPLPHPGTKETNPKDAIGDKKPPLWLCSPIAKAAWAVAQFVGMVKYGAWNWRSAGIRNSIYLSAIQRHLDAYMSGEEVDPVDQTPHMGHIMACAAIIIDAKAAGKLIDDRPPSVSLRAAYADCEKQMVLARKNYSMMNPKHYTIADTVSSAS